jgi:diguanylate cyclase (GGDEF)-like protein
MGVEQGPTSVLAKVVAQLAAIEKRDWELWLFVVVTGIIVGCGLLALIFPAAFLAHRDLRIGLQVPREFFLALLFKEVTTCFGHVTGDVVIGEIASLLKSRIRGCDAVIRYGGDEFLLILADAPLQGGQAVCGRITKSIEEWNREGHLKGFDLALSMGLAEWSEGKTLDQVLDEADRAMYSTKEAAKPTSGRD